MIIRYSSTAEGSQRNRLSSESEVIHGDRVGVVLTGTAHYPEKGSPWPCTEYLALALTLGIGLGWVWRGLTLNTPVALGVEASRNKEPGGFGGLSFGYHFPLECPNSWQIDGATNLFWPCQSHRISAENSSEVLRLVTRSGMAWHSKRIPRVVPVVSASYVVPCLAWRGGVTGVRHTPGPTTHDPKN